MKSQALVEKPAAGGPSTSGDGGRTLPERLGRRRSGQSETPACRREETGHREHEVACGGVQRYAGGE